jgi:guanylate cyclase
MLSAGVAALVVFPWPFFYLSFGIPEAAAIPAFYVVMTIAGMTYMAVTKRLRFFLYTQLAMVSVLPFLVHLALGGFVNSSVAVAYSIGGAVQALSYLGASKARWWFGMFVLLVSIAAFLDPALARNAPVVPPLAITVFFAVNIVAASGISFVSLVIYVDARDVLAAELETERERSEGLLLNVLPATVADRLKAGETPIADRYDDVAVLFADIAGSTEIGTAMEPDELVGNLNRVFAVFDVMTTRHGLEKIKTIGDAYMVVAGLSTESSNGLESIAELALEMRDKVSGLTLDGSNPLEMRLGIDAGPAVAGVIGTSKFAYDVYGDTVNTASRMESTGVINQIQVTERVKDRLATEYEFQTRGTVSVKGKGEIETFLLVGRV